MILEVRKRYALLKYSSSQRGSTHWLIGTEIKYGGLVSNVRRNKVSIKDPRSPQLLREGGMIGGDRMLYEGYAKYYSEKLSLYVKRGKPVTLLEFGILKGTGIAMWCDLFPNGRVIGLDIDLGHIQGNMANLKSAGAFRENEPELYEVDQFQDNSNHLGEILGAGRIDICIDDGFHSCETILKTMKSVTPYLANAFLYFVEDNGEVHKLIRTTYPEFIVESKGLLTIASRK
jgi:hypothetical protein